jgi:putative FmdB family regulatory protein
MWRGFRRSGIMPTYEYECQECGEVFERFHKMTQRPRVKCPKCGGRAKKLIGTGAGIIFKGQGFYATDYRSPEYEQAKKKETGSSKGNGAEKKDKEKTEKKGED